MRDPRERGVVRFQLISEQLVRRLRVLGVTVQREGVPAADGVLATYPVSKDVGNTRNNSPELLEAVQIAE